MEISVRGKKILVTGASRGIGKELVKTLVNGGAIVYALSKNSERLAELKKEFPSITTFAVDLNDWDETSRVLHDMEPVDGLVNNAGVAMIQPFLDITKETYDSIFNVNVRGLLNVSQIIARKMIQGDKHGSIVNVSSATSRSCVRGLAAYGASKSAVDSLTKAIGAELGPYKIRCNSVNPTVVMTDMGKEIWADEHKAEGYKARIPIGRFAEVEDVVNSILFLLSDKCLMTTGDNLKVDGGLTIVHD